ncbi:ComEA family DNA-binding protein [Rarobacter incanus]
MAADPAAGSSGISDQDALSAGTAGSAVETIAVHVVGAVNKPGVVYLRSGARGVDAVAAAGGLKANADARRINLAQPVSDGQQVVVPKRGEAAGTGSNATSSSAGSEGVASGSGQASEGGTELVDINNADAAQLQRLPGIGPAMAERIIAWRKDTGGCKAISDLLAVSGIGDARLEAIKDLITCGGGA